MTMTRRSIVETSLGASLIAMASACSRQDMKGENDLAALDAVETAARIKSGALSAEESIGAAIARARRIDQKINAIAFTNFDRAKKEAKAATGVMAGVPTFVKDLDDVVGEPTAFGSRGFPGYKGAEQSPLISKFLSLGLVSLGKSTTPEFGLTATTEPLNTGKTRNPWNTDYSTGGSSGGAAALVAAGVVPIAHASDGGGSIRVPASCCGNVGLKVSRGRYPKARPDLGAISISIHGVQSRTVRDTAAIVAAMESPPEESGLKPVGLVASPDKARLRIGLQLSGPTGRPVDAEVLAATRKVASVLESLGHSIVEMPQTVMAGMEEAFMLYWAMNAHAVIKVWEERSGLKRNGLAFEPFTLGLASHYEANAEKLDAAVARLKAASAEFDANFAAVDAILSPVLAAPPVKIGVLNEKLDYNDYLGRLLDYVQFTPTYNVVGAPAISLPMSMSKDGLPIGAMLGAAIGEEARLLSLSYELEEAAPWRDRKPTIFG